MPDEYNAEMISRTRRTVRAALVAFATLAIGVAAAGSAEARPGQAHPGHATPKAPLHYVYTQTNSATGNEVVGFGWNGSTLAPIGTWTTGGTGTGTWLGSQGSVVIEGNRLYVVNGASNDISMFAIGKNGQLRLLDREAVYGLKPVSVTVEGNRVVVLTTEQSTPCGGLMKCAPVQGEDCAGEGRCGVRLEDNLSLFRRHHDSLQLVSHVRLSGFGGAQVSFVGHPKHRRLVVTEKSSNTIASVRIAKWAFGTPTSVASAGSTPYGFGIAKHDTMVVSNAESEVPGAGTVSSYSLRKKMIQPVTSALATGQQAPCWVAIGQGGRTAYVSNPDSNTISLLRIGHRGALTLAAASAGPTANGPIDLEVHKQLLFVTAWQTLQVHGIAADGTISVLGGASIPDYSQGIAVK